MTEEQLLSAALLHSPESVSIYGLDGTVEYMNAATERIMGVSFDELRGKRLFELYGDAVGTSFHTAFQRVAAGGEPESFEHYYPRFEGWFANRVVRIGNHVHVYARDITEEMRRRRRSEALARISDVLTRNDLDVRDTAEAVARIVTDTVDAECVIALLSADREWLERVAQASCDEDTAEIMRGLARWSAHTGNPGEALRTRAAVLAQQESLARTTDAITDPALRDIVARYAPTSVLVVPLIVGVDPIGVVVVTRRRDRPPLMHHERDLLMDVAPSIGLYLALAGRRAEAQSLKNRLAALADSIPALVSFVDRDERYQYVNAGYERWFGTPPADYTGRHLRDMLGERAYATIAPHVKRALAGEEVRFRSRMAYPNGERDIDAQYMPLRGADGHVDGFAALVQDVTAEVRVTLLERRQREAERRTTARLESLLVVTAKLAGAARREDVERVLVDASFEALGASFAALWVLSSDGRELSLVRERGMREDVVLDYRRIKMTMPGPITDSVQLGRPIFASSREEYARMYPTVEPLHRPPGESPPIAFGVLPIVIEGTVIGCLNFSFYDGRELTNEERTYLEVLALHGAEALRRANLYAELRDVSESRAAMIQASPAAIMLLDEHGIVHAWNVAAERIFGVAGIDVVGRPVPDVDRQPDVTETLDRVLAGAEIHGQEVRRLRANGEWFDAECHAAPVTFSDGRTMCLSMIVDISERKRVERETARAFEDTRLARREAEAASRAKDEFLAMLGHELRNPLAPLVTAIELMRMRAPDQFTRERAVIQRQIDHLGRLVDDLLDVSRITRGKVDLRRERVSMASIAHKAIEQTSPLFEHAHHRLAIDVAPDLYVYGDATRLAQVVANLLTNAAKYTPNQGSIAIVAERRDGMIELTVRDNGIGIEPEMLPHVFDLFVQAPQSRARTRGGLGLGLTIVRSLVEMHGGYVRATSAGKNHGSEFSIWLPEAAEPVAVTEPERAPQLPRAAVSRRILVVDDNEDAANLLAEVLVAHGHNIRTALDGPSALRVADEFRPEVAVLDIGLPIMDGYELAERIRASPTLSGTRLIAVTGYGQESDRARAIDAGFHAHLAKPVAIDTLVQLVDEPT